MCCREPLPREVAHMAGRRQKRRKPGECGAFTRCAEEDSNLHPLSVDQALNLVTQVSDTSRSCASVQNVHESGRNGRCGRSGCCHGCCHERSRRSDRVPSAPHRRFLSHWDSERMVRDDARSPSRLSRKDGPIDAPDSQWENPSRKRSVLRRCPTQAGLRTVSGLSRPITDWRTGLPGLLCDSLRPSRASVSRARPSAPISVKDS